ncbi:MAG: MBL fold metallo-hydrolase [Candidatus Pacebacteria bacterium]|nr:MBL fold metallo-hydrolase [Candidatus Paceibacterota bacterium]
MLSFNKKGLIFSIILILIFIVALVWVSVYRLQDASTMTVAFLDVGQGDSIFIESPSGVQVLIDGGASNGVLRELSKVMPFYDRSINMVLATHPDTDHIGGLLSILKRYKVKYIARPGVAHDASAADSLLLEIAKEKNDGAVEMLARRGQVYDLGQGEAGRVELHILFPDRDVSNVESNLASVVARLTYGETSVLLTGDSSKAIENYLVSLSGVELKSDILKLGHHGSNTSSAKSFLGYVDPQWGIISAGENNRYGHPHQDVMDRIGQFKIIPLSTAERGTIIFKSNGREWRLQ